MPMIAVSFRQAKSLFGTEVWYGFSIRQGFPIRPLRFVAAQLKMPCAPSEDISLAFALRIDNGHWLATIEHLYEPKDKQQARYLSESNDGDCGLHAVPAFDRHNFDASRGQTDYQVRAILALDGAGLPAHLREFEFPKCTTGVEVHTHAHLPSLSRSWVDFVLHFAPSGIKDVDGLFELYANQNLIAQTWGEFGFAGTKTPDQYFKIEPYRNNDSKWGEEVAAIEIRDIRRGPRPENVGITASSTIQTQASYRA
jgi:Polysaccharide lyase